LNKEIEKTIHKHFIIIGKIRYKIQPTEFGLKSYSHPREIIGEQAPMHFVK
jgi:hypothetical protein